MHELVKERENFFLKNYSNVSAPALSSVCEDTKLSQARGWIRDMKGSELREALVHEIKSHGATGVYLDHRRGKHPKLRFEFEGRRLCYTLSGTPSDGRTIDAACSDIRRVMGVHRQVVKSRRPSLKRPRSARHRETICGLPRLANPVMRDDFKKLAQLRDRLIASATLTAFIADVEFAHEAIRAPQFGIRKAKRRINA